MNTDWMILPDVTVVPLRAVLRPTPALAPEDSLGRFVQTVRHLPVMELPVLSGGILMGMVSQTAAYAALAAPTVEERDRLLNRPLSEVLTAPAVVARPGMTPAEIGRLCSQHGVALVPVVDEDGYCLGIVLASDLLYPDLPTPKPAVIGGMATPFGVYLTDGSQQAGVSNLALISTGALMAVLFAIPANILIYGTNYGLDHHYLSKALFADPPPGQPLTFAATLVSVLIYLVSFFVFLVLMRGTRLAGFHAAEHQTVHAIERNEPLIPDVVRRMPRPHPRCGTNLMAAGTLFFTLVTLFRAIPALDGIGDVFAFLLTFTFWRRLGTWLQAYLTTKPATEQQLASGIAAGREVLEKYWNSPPIRVKPLRRIWCMGLVQVLIGTVVTSGLIYGLTTGLERLFSR